MSKVVLEFFQVGPGVDIAADKDVPANCDVLKYSRSRGMGFVRYGLYTFFDEVSSLLRAVTSLNLMSPWISALLTFTPVA